MRKFKEDHSFYYKVIVLSITLIIALFHSQSLHKLLLKDNEMQKKHNFIKQSHSISFGHDFSNSYMVFDNKDIITMESHNVFSNESVDGTSTVVMQDYDKLWYLKTGVKHKIAEPVDDYKVSLFGDKVLYFQQSGSNFPDNIFGALYLYNPKTRETKLIHTSAMFRSYALSPDGNTITYMEEYLGNWRIYKNNPPQIISKDLIISIKALTNDSQRIYCTYESNRTGLTELSIIENGVVTLLSNNVTNRDQFIFNYNNEQILYSANQETRLSTKEREIIKISDTPLVNVIIPNNTVSNEGSFGRVLGIIDYKNTFLLTTDSLVYISDSYEPIIIESQAVMEPKVDKGGETVSYIKNGILCEVTIQNSGEIIRKEWDSITDYITNYIIVGSGKHIYFTNAKQELWYSKDKEQCYKIAGAVDTYSLSSDMDEYLFFITEKDETFDELGNLNRLKIGDNKADLVMDKVMYYQATRTGVVVTELKDHEISVYNSTDGLSYMKIN